MIKRKHEKAGFGFCLTVIFLFFLLSGSIQAEEDSERAEITYDIYYLNQDETTLVPVQFKPETGSVEDVLQSLMLMLNDKQTTTQGLVNLMPPDVLIDSYSITEGILDLQLNAAYLEMAPEREILTRAGIVRTLLQIPGLTGVRLLVEDAELTDSQGERIGILTQNDFAELSDEQNSFRHETLLLYFTDKEGENLLEESRSVYHRETIPRERVLLEQLVKGPMEQDHYPTLPENLSINRIVIYDRVCHVDVGKALLDYPLDIPVQTAIDSLVKTVISSGCADLVQISVDGDEFCTLTDGDEEISLYQYFS